MNRISQPVFVVDQRLLLVYANKAFEAVAGDKLSEMTGKPFDQLTFFSQEVKVALAKMVGGIHQGEKIESYEMSFSNDDADDDGKTRFFESTEKIIDYFEQPASQSQTGGFCLGYWKRHQRRSFAKAVYALVHHEGAGHGFGLAICKCIIEAHGGTITVKTGKEKGTTFTITLLVEPIFQVGGENTWINIPESS